MAETPDTPTPPNPMNAFLWIAILILCGVGLYYCAQWRYPFQHWEDIQASGGIQIGVLLQKDGRILLPVKYDITGREAVTCEPTRKDAALMIEDLKAKRVDKDIVLSIIGSQATLVTVRTDIHYADMRGIAPGIYNVYYETAGDPQKLLGKVVIP